MVRQRRGRAPATPEPARRSVAPLSPLGKDAFFNRHGVPSYDWSCNAFMSSVVYTYAKQGIELRYNCNELRTMIKKMTKGGDMTIKDFQKEIHISSSMWYAFMNQKGTEGGMDTTTFKKVHQWFVDRGEKGLSVPEITEEDDAAMLGYDKEDEDGERADDVRIRLNPDSFMVKYNCTKLRKMIKTFIENSGITVEDFQKMIDVTPEDYSWFMKQVGPGFGYGSRTFGVAHKYFVDRDGKGLKMPPPPPKPEGTSKLEDKKEDKDDDVSNMSMSDGDSGGNHDINSSGDGEDEDEDKENKPDSSSSSKKYNCNQIRTKITSFINDNNMKVGEFQREIGTNARSYQSFMKQRGPHAGVNNGTYADAHQFFIKREEQGLKSSKSKPGTKTAGKKSTPRFKGKTSTENERFAYESLPKLEDEDEGEVEIYDTCDDVRSKIAAHLQNPSVTQASFCRELTKCQGARSDRHGGKGKPLQPVQMQSFLRKNGALAGSTSKAFYTAYVYFEKMRIRNREEKSLKREEMEMYWEKDGGVDTKTVAENVHCILARPAKGWGYDEYGRCTVVY